MTLDPLACHRAITARDARYDGRFFTCVRTTGVYCRPICPARLPKLENCVFMPTAAAAQAAGFRPCLRCRPESSPEFGAWTGTSATVSRALSLIEAGALDEASVDGLAERLGVGERHLRRLFHKHLGAAPITIAQTRRVLLAKQLIHQTDLPMTQVALAAGFGSLRRFNETFRQLYRRTPVELRRRRHASGPEIKLSLSYRPPYDWTAMLGFLEARAIAGVERVSDGVYRRVIAANGALGTVAVSHAPSDSALEVRLRLPDFTQLASIIARLRHLFDLRADPIAIGGHLASDPRLGDLVATRPGLRVPGAWDGFEIAVRAILGQQVSVAAATRLAGELAAAYGTPLATEDGSGLARAFPTPARLAAEPLRLPMPRARAAAISQLAAAALADPQLFQPRRNLAASIARLRDLPGIGEWTAQYIAMRGLRESDAFPAGDVALLRALADPRGRRPSADEMLKMAEAWRPWRAYAALQLWTSDGAGEAREPVATDALAA